jgi:hypothetical protein
VPRGNIKINSKIDNHCNQNNAWDPLFVSLKVQECCKKQIPKHFSPSYLKKWSAFSHVKVHASAIDLVAAAHHDSITAVPSVHIGESLRAIGIRNTTHIASIAHEIARPTLMDALCSKLTIHEI